MPLPWGRLFWTFVVGLCAGIVGYAIYRGDLRWELPAETELRISRSQATDSEPVLPAPELAEPVADPTPPVVAPAETEPVDTVPDTDLQPPADEPETAPVEDSPLLPPVEAAAAESPAEPVVVAVIAPEPKPAPEPIAVVEKPEPDFLIVPGVRVGAVVPGMSESELEDAYGARNVAPIEVAIGEGFSEPGTALFPGDAKRELQILWRESKPNRLPRVVYVKGKAWKTAEGIALGTSLRKLEGLNGGSFTLSGFGWAYSGAVVSWANGKLGPLLQARGRVQLWLKPPANASPGKLVGDKDFRSSNPAMRSLDPRVYQLSVEFPGAGTAAKR